MSRYLCTLLLLVPCVVCIATAAIPAAEPSEMLVSGIGYPPLKAESSAQALFMARRAALLDAYRNALQREKDSDPASERFFHNVAGFLRNVRIVDEAYLDDGAVLMTVAVKNGRDASFRPRTAAPNDALSPAAPRQVSGPAQVSLDEWMKIIARLVRFDVPETILPSSVEEP